MRTTLPFYPNAANPSECEQFVKEVFEAIVKHYGEDEARRIFGPYGKPRTKREINADKNEELLFWYYLEEIKADKEKRKPNVRRLGRRLAEESKTDPDALERKIWRVVKEKPEIKNDDLLRLIALAQGAFDVCRVITDKGIIEIRRSDD